MLSGSDVSVLTRGHVRIMLSVTRHHRGVPRVLMKCHEYGLCSACTRIMARVTSLFAVGGAA